MIIDAILDRRDGDPWDREAWEYVREEAEIFEFAELVRALDGGRNADMRRELCAYVDRGGYNPAIKEYVNSVDWTVNN